MKRRVAALSLGLVLVATSCGSAGLPESASEQGEGVTTLWRLFLVIAVLVVALIWGLVAWCVVRYRRRDDELPTQKQYNIPIEVVYTIVPLVLVGVLFALSVASERDVSDLSDDPDLVVDVLGFQWDWQFTYEGEDVRVVGRPGEAPVLRLPVGRTVQFDLRADDVIHSFWVPEFITKRDMIPRIDNTIEIDVTREGTWTGRCAEFCGLDHASMDFTVEALPADEFDAWLADAAAGRLDDPTLASITGGTP